MAEQLPLPFAENPAPDERSTDRERVLQLHQLRCYLEKRLGRAVEITVTDNRRSMLSTTRRGERYYFRLHHMFLGADDPTVLTALVDFAHLNTERARLRIRQFIESRRHMLQPAREVGQLATRSDGEVYDLQPIFDQLDADYFDSSLGDVSIGWGRNGRARGKHRRSIRLGAYFPKKRLIRIHPLLDREIVPRFFVEAVVHHEMVHAFLHQTQRARPGRVHCSLFRELEQKFAHHEAARAWELEELPTCFDFE
ncbi:MAG: hypothetical protein KC609_12415 [Myxococcales bacterium]|nr:hypothetical protein [Myxococcales bacterium]